MPTLHAYGNCNSRATYCGMPFSDMEDGDVLRHAVFWEEEVRAGTADKMCRICERKSIGTDRYRAKYGTDEVR